MPNKPKTPLRNVRVDDALWGAAMARAVGEGRTLSEVVRGMLRDYVDRTSDPGVPPELAARPSPPPLDVRSPVW